ncbi:hypothetical protein [Sporichthya sp.]|uniref:hypothetical protein n=1 Tax=Sporichthya sp. TaxID=65475 RepID=UPI0017C869E7|nr:hypothetical protein [Sporichthya sp.]MBA3743284.1 hypothetical protein [Sporichthya sp.]
MSAMKPGRRSTAQVYGRGALVGIVALGLSGLWVGLSASARADDATFDAIASSNGSQTTLFNQSIPVGLTLEGSGPLTRAQLNTLGDSDALAAFPYPGDVAAGLPGIAGALVGVNTPAYPLVAATAYGDAPKDVNYPGVALHAESSAQQAAAKALAGTDHSGYVSVARVGVQREGGVLAVGETTLNGFTLGDKFSVAVVHSRAEVLADGATGALTRSSKLALGSINVPGLRLEIPCTTPSYIPLPNPVPGAPQAPPVELEPTEIPAPFGCSTMDAPELGFEDGVFTVTLPYAGGPATFPLPTDSVLSALKASGIEVAYQPAQESTTGIVGAGLTFSYVIAEPPANPYYSGPTKVTSLVGQAIASVNLRPVGASQFAPGSGAIAPGEAGLGLDGASVPGIGAPGSLGTGTGLDAAGLDTRLLLPDNAGASAGTSFTRTTESANVNAPVGSVYLALIAAALAAFVGATVIRILGVRYLWS